MIGVLLDVQMHGLGSTVGHYYYHLVLLSHMAMTKQSFRAQAHAWSVLGVLTKTKVTEE